MRSKDLAAAGRGKGPGAAIRVILLFSALQACCALVPTRACAAQRRAPEPDQLRNEQRLKQELVEANLILFQQGLIGPFGHVSVRAPGSSSFWIARDKAPNLVEPKDLQLIAIDGPVPSGAYSEIFIHRELYRARPDVNSVVHTHSLYAIALSVVEKQVRPVSNSGARHGPIIPVYEKIGLIESEEKGRELARILGPAGAVLLRGHGAVIVGRGLKEAVFGAISLEREAQVQAIANCLGTPRLYTEEETRHFSGRGVGGAIWEFYRSLIQRRPDPAQR